MNKKIMVKDIFFDLDHTLWDFDKNSILAFKRVFKKFKIDPAASIFLDDNKSIVRMAKKCGIESAYHVLEPTSDKSVIYESTGLRCLKNITKLI